MMLFVSGQRLAPLCLLFLLFGTFPLGGWSRPHVAAGFPDGLPNINTQVLLRKLEAHDRRRLQGGELLAIGVNETMEEIGNSTAIATATVTPNSATPSNGCTICQGTSFLPDKIPNQNFFPDLGNATCQQWQDVILPEILPEGETCQNNFVHQLLFVMCCQTPIPRYECEANVHNLHNSRNINNAIPPVVSHDEPLVVSTDVIYEWVKGVDVQEGTATVRLTINLKWKDPRLAWTVNETYCADYISLYTAYGQGSSIWVPDFSLLNGEEAFRGSSQRQAIIYSDGTVRWTTGGMTTATCQYKGLGSIPFDTLGCQFLYGHRSRGDANMIYFKHEDEDTIKVTKFDIQYSQYTPAPELFEKGYTWYLNEDYSSALYYNFFFKRATHFYIVNIVIPTIFLTYCSFFTFLLDVRIGERIGYAMALALVIVANQIVTVDRSPVSNRKLWLNKFAAWSFYWVLLVLIQSVVVGFFFFFKQDYEEKEQGNKISILTTRPVTNSFFSEEDPRNRDSDGEMDTIAKEKPTKVSISEPRKKPPIYLMFSTRKFDYICLVFFSLSYTIFLIAMLVSAYGGSWVEGEAEWETHDSKYHYDVYKNMALEH